MSEEQIRKQLLELDFPNLCRLTVTVEVHPRCVALCHDGKEYAVTIHEKLCNRAKVYYHGSKAVCIGGSVFACFTGYAETKWAASASGTSRPGAGQTPLPGNPDIGGAPGAGRIPLARHRKGSAIFIP